MSYEWRNGFYRCQVCNKSLCQEPRYRAVLARQTHEASMSHQRAAELASLSPLQHHVLSQLSAYGSVQPGESISIGTLRSLQRRGIVETFHVPTEPGRPIKWRLTPRGEWLASHNGDALLQEEAS